MPKIQLVKLEELSDGTQRLQSQLYVGKTTSDFIIDCEGVIKVWDYGDKGFAFYPFYGQFEIVEKINGQKL